MDSSFSTFSVKKCVEKAVLNSCNFVNRLTLWENAQIMVMSVRLKNQAFLWKKVPKKEKKLNRIVM